MKKKLQNKKGFTLVELIVVIVIILVLAAVLVPTLMKYVTKAQEAKVKQELSIVADAVETAKLETAAEYDITEKGLIYSRMTPTTPADKFFTEQIKSIITDTTVQNSIYITYETNDNILTIYYTTNNKAYIYTSTDGKVTYQGFSN